MDPVRHTGPGDLVETARVIKVTPDLMGIPHVRYDLMVARARQRADNVHARRTLNLDTFASHFSEPVEA